MKLDKENMRKMRQLILFTVIILIALWNYEMIFGAIRFAFGIIFPFLLGGGIAFVLNVPMSFFEEKLFYNRYLKDKKIANRIARPVSLVLTIAVLIGVIVLVMFVVIPELTKTVISLGKTIQTFIPEAQRFLEELFTDNSEVRAWLEGLNLISDDEFVRLVAILRLAVPYTGLILTAREPAALRDRLFVEQTLGVRREGDMHGDIVLDGVRVCAGRIEHDDALFRALADGNVVHAGKK